MSDHRWPRIGVCGGVGVGGSTQIHRKRRYGDVGRAHVRKQHVSRRSIVQMPDVIGAVVLSHAIDDHLAHAAGRPHFVVTT